MCIRFVDEYSKYKKPLLDSLTKYKSSFSEIESMSEDTSLVFKSVNGYTIKNLHDFIGEMFVQSYGSKDIAVGTINAMRDSVEDLFELAEEWEKKIHTNTKYLLSCLDPTLSEEFMLKNVILDEGKMHYSSKHFKALAYAYFSDLHKKNNIKFTINTFNLKQSVFSLSTMKTCQGYKTTTLEDSGKTRFEACFDAELKGKGKIIDLVEDYLEEEYRPVVALRMKPEAKGGRHFGKLDLVSLASLGFVEKVAMSVMATSDSEWITVRHEDRISKMEKSTRKLYAEGKRKKMGQIAYFNFDASSWGPSVLINNMIDIFKIFRKVGFIDKRTYRLVRIILMKWSQKIYIMPKHMVQHLRHTTDKLWDVVLDAVWSMVMGQLNVSSSAGNVVMFKSAELLTKYELYKLGKIDSIWQTFPELTVDSMSHSDDGNAGILASMDVLIQKFMFWFMVSAPICNIIPNFLKSNLHQLIREFITQFIFKGSAYFPVEKLLRLAINSWPTTSYSEDYYSMMSRVREAYRKGVPESVAYFYLRVGNQVVCNVYRNGKGMRNDPERHLGVDSRLLSIRDFGLMDVLPTFMLLDMRFHDTLVSATSQ